MSIVSRLRSPLLRLAGSRWLLVFFILMSLFPLVYPSLYWLTILAYLLAMGLFALSYDIVLGQTGILSFGQAASFGLGAYAVYWVVNAGYPFAVGVVAGMLLGAGVNVVMGVAIRRVKGVSYAMFTLAFAEVIYLYLSNQVALTGGEGGVLAPRPAFLQNTNVTLVFTGVLLAAAICVGYVLISFYLRRGERVKGVVGIVILAGLVIYGLYNFDLSVLPSLSWPIAAFTVNAYLLSVLLLFVSYFLVSRLMRSPLGAVMVAARENDERTNMLGFDTFKYKLVSMGISGLFAGLAGAMLASLASFVITPDLMSATYTLNVLLYCILGGIGTLIGPIIGAFIIQFLYFNIGTISQMIGFPSLADWWMLIIGVFYILVVLFLPYGVVWTVRLKGRSTLSRLRRALGGKE
jgi:ABC-type branched-subunit amino acid transport system permease subunit